MTHKKLPESIRSLVDPNLAKPTRIHKLPSNPNGNLWIKREDELSSGISGSKMRKYASMIPFLKARSITNVGMIGGPNSNNLVGLAQLLRENGIRPIAFIREAADDSLRGNALLLKMLLGEEEVVPISRAHWSSVDTIARDHLQKHTSVNAKSFLLAEGCFGPEALPGTFTLAEDILRNEAEHSVKFERIYVDSGTGLGAIGLILGLEFLSESEGIEREIVVTLIAGTEKRFREDLNTLRKSFIAENGRKDLPRLSIRFLFPTLSPKFGSVNQSLLKACGRIARREGILMDPTYSVKHYEASKSDFTINPTEHDSLFILNGSAIGLAGFQEKLSTLL
ncbi:hypothetical protein VDG1235_4063 [Verrucomicrobiia bacterium DG1235]|nr:hypothetical protein VDG1235_4063 [Verrucomicrobiae bacterium DG1235]